MNNTMVLVVLKGELVLSHHYPGPCFSTERPFIPLPVWNMCSCGQCEADTVQVHFMHLNMLF